MPTDTRSMIDLTDPQVELRDAVRDAARRFKRSYWTECDEQGEFPWEFYRAFADAGWLGLAVPAEYGGSGLGMIETALVLEEAIASGAGTNGCRTMLLTMVGLNVIAKHGSEGMRREVLPLALKGDLQVCLGVTEADLGIDRVWTSTLARREGGFYFIDSRQAGITVAARPEKVLLVARTTPREQGDRLADGMTLFLVDLASTRVEMRPILTTRRNAVSPYEWFIDGLRVPADARIGEEGEAFRCLPDVLNPERILLAHEALGLGGAAVEAAIGHEHERMASGRSVGASRGNTFPLAEAAARLAAARVLARRAAWLYDMGEPCDREAGMARLTCADASRFAVDQAVRTFGGKESS
ncbi:acyl-CoA dehydrogenase family protein [Spirillospora sp. CA-108201]